MDTNNEVEAQNKQLKYSHLPRSSTITLSHLLAVLVDSFLPQCHQKYLFENHKMGENYRSYNALVPKYLQGRPRKIIIHCLQRMEKAHKFSQLAVSSHDPTKPHEVHSPSGKTHEVDVRHPSCSCRDWLRFNIPCKHMFAVFKCCSECSWDSLPETYKQSEYLSADSSVLMDGETATEGDEDKSSEMTAETGTELTALHGEDVLPEKPKVRL